MCLTMIQCQRSVLLVFSIVALPPPLGESPAESADLPKTPCPYSGGSPGQPKASGDHGRHPAAPFCPHDIPDLRYICYFCSYSAYTPVPGLVNTIPEPLITLNGPWSNRCMLKLAEKLPPMGL